MSISQGVRIDKFLWAVRVFKTRNQATDACRSGKVVIDEVQVKPSREVKVADRILVRVGGITRTFIVVGTLQNRVSASIVPSYIEDITSKEELEKQQMIRELNTERRESGSGRPSKKDRREIERLKGT